MAKLLDKVKILGFTHEEAIKILENYKPDKKTDESDDTDTEVDQNDKTEQETKASDKKKEEDKTKALVKKLADEEEAKIKADESTEKAKIVKLVQEELKKRGKITRKTPSKGKIVDTPSLHYDINIKGYEVKTIRTKK